MEIDVKNVSERGGQPGRRQKKSLPPRTDAGRCIAMGGVVAPAGYKEPTGDSPPASECSNVFEGQAEAEVERLNKTTSEKVALRHWTSDERINGYENEPSVWTRPTVEALLPYNRRRREGGATARAGARARGGKEEKRPSRTALKQARAVKTGQVQLQRRAPRLPREHGTTRRSSKTSQVGSGACTTRRSDCASTSSIWASAARSSTVLRCPRTCGGVATAARPVTLPERVGHRSRPQVPATDPSHGSWPQIPSIGPVANEI